MPSEVAFNKPPPVSPPGDADDAPPEKPPPEPAPLPTPGKPAWCRVAFHTWMRSDIRGGRGKEVHKGRG